MPYTINMSTIGDTLLHANDASFDSKVEAVVVYNNNLMAVAPDPCKVIAGFTREGLFTVVLEHFRADTADYADILLPATTQLEHVDMHRAYDHTYVLANNAAIVPMGQSLPNTEIFYRIAQRVGFDDACLANSDDDIASQAMHRDDPAATHIDQATLRRKGWRKLVHPATPLTHNGHHTPSGRCESYSGQMTNDGLDPLPGYMPPYESAISTSELAERHPLSVISPLTRNFLNSTFVNTDNLRSAEGEPHLDIHPDDANAHDVVDGESIRIFNDRGTMQVRTRAVDHARRGVVVGLST